MPLLEHVIFLVQEAKALIVIGEALAEVGGHALAADFFVYLLFETIKSHRHHLTHILKR